ncbi:MAG TPA: metallophosphoesterase [Turneriella sp.]|nr:metallophosphoesterase [Turneriella sp.]
MKLAIIGDMHQQFDADDISFFNASDYDALLFVGDLASKNPESVFKLLPHLESLTKPAYLILGNHDTTGIRQLIGEITHADFLVQLGTPAQTERMERLKNTLKHVTLCGYSIHDLGDIRLLAARPFSMGDSRASKVAHPMRLTVNFKPYMQKNYNVATLQDSALKLQSLINAVNPPYLILAHNGPYGLGKKVTDLFGADFLPEETDFGDRDLKAAIDYAHKIGKPPLAVVAGHMHYPTKHGNIMKEWYKVQEDVHYINAARWPRIFRNEGRLVHHHVALSFEGKNCIVEAREIVYHSM